MPEQQASADVPKEGGSALGAPIDGLRTLIQGLWACRVSLFSVAVGGYVLWNVAQVHDLFVELRSAELARTHWALFFASVLVFWILPVHLSARLMLEVHAFTHPTEFVTRRSRVVAAFPWMLSLLVIAAIGMSIFAAKRNIPLIEAHAPEQVRKLLTAAQEQVDTLLLVTGGAALAFLFVWAVVFPLTSRLTRRSGLLETWLVRKVAELLFDRERRLRDRETLSAEEREEIQRTMTHRRQIAVAALLLFVLWAASCTFVLWRPLDIPVGLRRAPMLPIVFGAWVPILTLPAYLATRWRLPLLTMFVLALTFFGAFGRDTHAVRLLQDKEVRTSLLTGTCFPDHRGLIKRQMSSQPVEARQIGLEQAIEMWRQANGCPYGQPCNKRPIIVAAEGGASRASFFAASVLSYLQDTSPVAPSGRTELSQQLFAISSVSGGALGAATFAAALDDTGHTRAGPAEGRLGYLDTSEKAADALWFRNGPVESDKNVQSVQFGALVQPALRNPLQVILSGDFLSPVAAGLGLDVWWRLQCEDRAAIIERAWERRYAQFIPPPAVTAAAAAAPGAPKVPHPTEDRDPEHGLARPLASYLPTSERWRPLLIFNGSSVLTGRRIITSTLHPLTQKAAGAETTARATRGQPVYEPVFGDSYDFYDHLCHSAKAAEGGAACQCSGQNTPRRTIKGCDIRLSTAVSNSARFPIISPHGDIRDPAGGTYDRVVDGGYFDNFGVLSATELATQMRAFDERQAKAKGGTAAGHVLNPFILLISNDPEFNPAACPNSNAQEATRQRSTFNQARYARGQEEYETRGAPEPPKDEGTVAFSMLRYPAAAALRSWTASARTAPTRLGLLSPADYSFGIVQVCPQYLSKTEVKPVSMNWWLSMPVQAFLDSQVCGTHNDLELRSVAALLNGKTDKDVDWQAWVAEWERTRVFTCEQRARPKRSIEYGPGGRTQR